MTVEAVWEVGATLGEGPVWQDGALWFTDIKQRKIHRHTPDGNRSWDAPDQPGFLVPAAGGGFIAGLKSGLHHFDPESGAFRLLTDPEPDLPCNRLNDATVAPDGHLWFGTMDDAEAAVTGRIYRLDADGVCRARTAPVAITNGPAFSPDGGTLYHTDTLGGVIHAATVRDGEVVGSRMFARIDPADGYPDGPTVDSEGCVWTGLWGGGRARRFSPEGVILQEIRFPAANITKVAFGGDDLKTLYATSARKGLSDAERAAQPLAGSLFATRVDVAGLPVTRVRFGLS